MKAKNKVIIFLVIILELTIIYKIGQLRNNVIETDLKLFQPFSKNNILITVKTDFKLDNNLPKIEAASAFYPFTATMVQNLYKEEFYNEDLLKIVSTGQVYKDIIRGDTDIIIATAPSDIQKLDIKNSNIELEFVPLYLEPLAILVNDKNNTENLTIEQIKKIYYEKDSRWEEYGGTNSRIITYQLESNNGSQTSFESIVKSNILNKNHRELRAMPTIVDKVANDRNGIGYAYYSYLSKMYNNINVKVINVNGKNIKDKNYPLLFEVYLIYRKDTNNENINKLVKWIKTKEGNEFIQNIV